MQCKPCLAMRIIIFYLLPLILGYTFGDRSDALFFDKSVEKLFVQFLGVVNFVMQTEHTKPMHEEVTFHFYSKLNSNKAIQLRTDDTETLLQSQFQPSLRTIFIIHGYTDHKERDIIVALRRALIENLQEVNVIVVDWKGIAALIYFNAAAYTSQIGRYLAKFLAFLEQSGLDLTNVHLIGHSLGAQISGVTGDYFNGRIGRITGLDPAGPLFEFITVRNSTESVDQSDAIFVDVIHTASLDFGVSRPVGHADFYPNYGLTPQPGCSNFFTAISCSHIRSVEFFTESINSTKKFLAKPCSFFGDGSPSNCKSRNFVEMGYYTSTQSRGMYYLQTNSAPPYAMGNKFYSNPSVNYIKQQYSKT